MAGRPGVVKGAAAGAAAGAVAGPEGAAAGATGAALGGAAAKRSAARPAGGAASQSGPPSKGSGATGRTQTSRYVEDKAISGARKAHGYRWSGRGSNPRRMLVAEFVVCMIILALSPMSQKHGSDNGFKWMQRGGAVSLLFLIFGLIATLSDRAGRVAAAMGLTVTVGLLVSDADVFQNFLAGLQAPAAPPAPPIAPGTGDNNGPPPPPSFWDPSTPPTPPAPGTLNDWMGVAPPPDTGATPSSFWGP